MSTFSTINTEHLIYTNSVLDIEVLGGIRLEGLDRMRVTLKVSLHSTVPFPVSEELGSGLPPIRHNLDLYNDTQLEKFIRKLADRLELGTSLIAGSLAELTQHLETYRLTQIEDSHHGGKGYGTPLTEKEKAKAIGYLQQENLLEITSIDLAQSGIQGERSNALILWLAMTSRKMSEPLSVICLAKSGTGKSYLMDRVARCIPLEDQKEHTQFTGNAFYYYKREEIKHKVFIIKDLQGAIQALFPIRELQSEQRISKTITRKGRDGKLETITLVVEGPVSVIAVTTEERIYEDNANRSILIYLDSSKAQDERIMYYQKQQRAGLINSYQESLIRQDLQHLQKVLMPIKVVNPYAPYIDLPEDFPKKRRALPILLNFIEAITFYHQYQRIQKASKETGELYIESSIQDVIQGFKYLKDVLYRRSDELDGAVRDFYERLQEVVTTQQLFRFKLSEIRMALQMPPRTVQHYIKQLVEYNYIALVGGKQRTGYEYEITSCITRKELESRIENHIHTMMERLETNSKNTKSPYAQRISKAALTK